MQEIRVKRSAGAPQGSCACGSWLEHWKRFSGQNISFCPVNSCLNKDLVGAFVRRSDASDDKWYVFPLCEAHSKSEGVLMVSKSYHLVPADPAQTCQKPNTR